MVKSLSCLLSFGAFRHSPYTILDSMEFNSTTKPVCSSSSRSRFTSQGLTLNHPLCLSYHYYPTVGERLGPFSSYQRQSIVYHVGCVWHRGILRHMLLHLLPEVKHGEVESAKRSTEKVYYFMALICVIPSSSEAYIMQSSTIFKF